MAHHLGVQLAPVVFAEISRLGPEHLVRVRAELGLELGLGLGYGWGWVRVGVGLGLEHQWATRFERQ